MVHGKEGLTCPGSRNHLRKRSKDRISQSACVGLPLVLITGLAQVISVAYPYEQAVIGPVKHAYAWSASAKVLSTTAVLLESCTMPQIGSQKELPVAAGLSDPDVKES